MAQRAINTCDIAHCTEHPLRFVSVAVLLFVLFVICFFLFFSLLRSRDIPWAREIFPSHVVGSLGRALVSATGRHLFGQRPGGTTL